MTRQRHGARVIWRRGGADGGLAHGFYIIPNNILIDSVRIDKTRLDGSGLDMLCIIYNINSVILCICMPPLASTYIAIAM